MSLEIHANHAYAKPDLYINGLLTAYPDDREIPFKAASLLVYLTGRSRTRIQGPDGKFHEQSIVFFEMSKEVYPGPAELGWRQQTTYSLHLPNDPAAPEPHEADMIWDWNTDKPPPQVLPPSGEFGPGNVITYEVQARMLDQSQLIREIRSNCLLVNFSQTRLEEDVDHAITRLVTNQPIKTSKTTDVTLDLPQTVIQGGTFPLLLRLSSQTSSSRYSLSSCSLNFVEKTVVTCEEQSEHTTNTIVLGAWTASGIANATAPLLTISDDGLDMSQILDQPKIPESCAPSFSSGNIQRSYAFNVIIDLSLEDQTYSLTFNLDPLVVRAAETVDQAKAQQRQELQALANDDWD